MSERRPHRVTKLVVANLHAEAQWARQNASQPALHYASAAGALMRVLCDDGDLLWLPTPFDAMRLVVHERLPRPTLVTGALEAVRGYHAMLAWAETQDVAKARAKRGVQTETRADVAAHANHRGFFLEVAQHLQLAHPGTAFITSIDALLRHVAKAGLAMFVAKEPLSAAGRGKHVLHVEDLADAAKLRALAARIAACGGVLVEPWVTRTFDFGVACEVDAAGSTRIVGLHRQLIDERGHFMGLRLVACEREPAWLDAASRERVTFAVDGVGAALTRLRYSGPFTLDGYGVKEPSGAHRIHVLGEINARLTMGRLAHELGARMEWTHEFELRVGDIDGCEVTLVAKGAPDGVGIGVRPAR